MSNVPSQRTVRKILECIRDELARKYEHGLDPDAYVPATIDGLNTVIEALEKGIHIHNVNDGGDS